MEKTLSIQDFTLLLLATLAKNSQVIDLKNSDKLTVKIPVNYKQIIENILCAENGWKYEFSILIDINEYFDDHFAWELELSLTLKEVLNNLKKDVEYDFSNDMLIIPFYQNEIDIIMKNYTDELLLNTMDHFASLLVDLIYTREFQENFHDYSASAVTKMKNSNEEKYANEEVIKHPQKKRRLTLFRKN